MMKKGVLTLAILFALGTVSLACARPHEHRVGNTSVIQQTTLVGTFAGNPGAATQQPAPEAEETSTSAGSGDSTMVSATLSNRIERAGDITSLVSDGDHNQANAAAIAITGNSQVSGKVVNRIDTAGNITATVEDGSNNLANAGSVAIRGAVSSGKIMNRVGETGDITAMVSGGDSNQANAASVAIN